MHRVFDVLYVANSGLERFRSSFAREFEAVDLWFVEVDLWREDDGHRIVLHENMREGSAEVGAVDVDLPDLWKIDFFTARTESLES